MLRLYVPISERSCCSPCRGPCSPSKAPLSFHQTLTPRCEEEGPNETVRLGQADKCVFTDSTGVDDTSELIPLCLECQAFMSMGNQQGTNLKTNYPSYIRSRDTSPKSPRIQIPRKRRRSAGGSGNLQHKPKVTPKTQQMPPNSRRMTNFQVTSSPVFEGRHLEENRPIIGTPAARRKDRVERSVSLSEERNIRTPQELKPARGAKLPDASSAHVYRSSSQKDTFCHGEDLSTKEEDTLVDSDTDLSEYDNETYSMCISQSTTDRYTNPSPSGKTEGSTANTGIPGEAFITQLENHKHEGGKAEVGEKKSSQWWFEEMAKRAAAQRVIGKIEEVEEILRRVSLTSSDWIKERSKWGIESDPFIESKKTLCKQNPRQPLHEFHFTSNCSAVDNNSSSPSISTGGPPSLYRPGPSQHLSDQDNPDISEGHVAEMVEDSLFPWGAGSCGFATAVSSETENNKRRNLAPATLRLNEQNQSYRCIRETETSHEDLLFSGTKTTVITK